MKWQIFALFLVCSCGKSGSVELNLPALSEPKSAIKHVVLIVQENHTFDNYFGQWCTAPAGSNPLCSQGPPCCEGAPETLPGLFKSTVTPTMLDDQENAAFDPNHSKVCEEFEINGGKMDRFISGKLLCSNPRNYAIAPAEVVQTYHDWASQYAIADRYFQPITGQSSANDMYFAIANYVFTDNDYQPVSIAKNCSFSTAKPITYKGKKTIADLLTDKNLSFHVYAEGYRDALEAQICPKPVTGCTPKLFPLSPCVYDPTDNPFLYYEQFGTSASFVKDFDADFFSDVQNGTLPEVSFIKAVAYHNEHPGYGTPISLGVSFAKSIVDAILADPKYNKNTLILLVWDEGGGYYDHVPPPKNSSVDQQPYGTRVPFLAIGHFAKKGHVSHTEMEHSSIVKFLEWNFLGESNIGALGGRDAVVNSIEDLLDETKVGLPKSEAAEQ